MLATLCFSLFLPKLEVGIGQFDAMFQIARFTLQHIHQLQQKLCAGYGRTRLNVADMGIAYVAGVTNHHLLHYKHENLSYARTAKPLIATVCGEGAAARWLSALFGGNLHLKLAKSADTITIAVPIQLDRAHGSAA